MQHILCIKDTEEKFPQEFLNTATFLFYHIGPLSKVSIGLNTKKCFSQMVSAFLTQIECRRATQNQFIFKSLA